MNQQSKDHFKKAVKELAYISGLGNQIHYSIDDRPDICAQAVATLIKADQRDQAWKGSFTGQAEELREHIKRRAEEIGEKIREVFSHIIRPKSTTKPGKSYDEFLKEVTRKIKR